MPARQHDGQRLPALPEEPPRANSPQPPQEIGDPIPVADEENAADAMNGDVESADTNVDATIRNDEMDTNAGATSASAQTLEDDVMDIREENRDDVSAGDDMSQASNGEEESEDSDDVTSGAAATYSRSRRHLTRQVRNRPVQRFMAGNPTTPTKRRRSRSYGVDTRTRKHRCLEEDKH